MIMHFLFECVDYYCLWIRLIFYHLFIHISALIILNLDATRYSKYVLDDNDPHSMFETRSFRPRVTIAHYFTQKYNIILDIHFIYFICAEL